MIDASAPYRLVPGAVDSPVILHVPHGSRVIPATVRAGILLDDVALERELDHITDAYTDRIAERAADRSAGPPWRFVNQLSRLVVDPERFPDEREEMLAVGMGAVYTRTTHREALRPADHDGRPLLDRYFHPYAAAMTDAVTHRLEAAGRAVVVDVHSYPTRALPYELHGDGPRPPVCLGSDPFHTPPELLAAAEQAFAGFGGTAVNTPFAGAYVPLKYYGTDPRVTALMIEIRRDVYMAEPGGPAGPGLEALAGALARLVDLVTT
ncbi:N-formylglutamate amidohydrolase [Streptomyces ipomoeae]|jgi:N-formylglutamate amidohydrolase|uniref:N-formylglutamate amidohydrolase n=4 Tax=Streptomyces ipomoeae TaxID=103232 RepID=L1KQC3_9ACTN|nr:N-formylglutamate amidohydrolase [Streptomyces ipomoeae]EKX63001.1 N-formylglutamate amidohydrolase [Streptomyces ipomoeae 91-03]MDX2696468.1 N-formylglutamate amidohydrolase [Streptomyces ipomoeae]MDX2840862.1 N-formylglutamate amidohydrolase [Streptomyces ipomoeae]MDX2879060.1 N-formylglutamate amidohydrolase [Streptomyces ipomoeae]TQE36739.1 N-formylglutamate amidohydrolase [Streptomyces ipomoeae]